MIDTVNVIVPAALVVVGWLVLFTNAKKIESRKEIRKLTDIIIRLVDEISSDTRQYYSTANKCHSGHLSNKIKADISLVSHYLFLLKSCGFVFSGTNDLIDFRKIITGSFFETQEFMKQLEIPGWAAEFAANQAKLKLSLNRSYFKWTKAIKG